jgi:RND family efflux transporter MFP subunit
MVISKRNVLGAIGLLILVLALLTYFTSAEHGEKVSVDSMAADVKTVRTTIARPEDVPLFIDEVGLVEAFRQVTVVSETSGRVIDVLADVGDTVDRDDVIIVLEDELPRFSFEEAKAGVIIAEASFEKARKDRERGEDLLGKKDISLNEYESLDLAYRNAEGSLLRARALRNMAEKRYRDTKISSPIDGIVTSRMLDTGEMASQGMPVAVVVDAESVKVTVGVTGTDVVNLVEDQPCDVSVDAFPGRTFPGRVNTISRKADEETGTFPVEVVAPNTDSLELRSGMVAQVSIRTGTIPGVITLPRDAIDKRGGRQIAFVVEADTTAVERTLRTGPSFGEKVVVREGISPGDRVVVVGTENLTSGDRVTEGR